MITRATSVTRETCETVTYGCSYYACYADIDDPDRFVCLEQWTDAESVRAHLAAPHYLEADAVLDRLRAEPAEVHVFTAEGARL